MKGGRQTRPIGAPPQDSEESSSSEIVVPRPPIGARPAPRSTSTSLDAPRPKWPASQPATGTASKAMPKPKPWWSGKRGKYRLQRLQQYKEKKRLQGEGARRLTEMPWPPGGYYLHRADSPLEYLRTGPLPVLGKLLCYVLQAMTRMMVWWHPTREQKQIFGEGEHSAPRWALLWHQTMWLTTSQATRIRSIKRHLWGQALRDMHDPDKEAQATLEEERKQDELLAARDFLREWVPVFFELQGDRRSVEAAACYRTAIRV